MSLFRIMLCGFVVSVTALGQDSNLRIVTDASPDYTDMKSMVSSITSQWSTPKEKCWAMFYWNHIARRQTSPMILHGLELADPIRQFNDYGFTQCSTISGINQSIWEHMGLKHKYWDIHVHTVAEVEYDGKFHCYDNSLSAIYTLCDGVTLASVEDVGKDGACALSGGKVEPGHIARYHCLTATSPNGFLIGGDCSRSLNSEGCHVFRAPGLAYRNYFYDWDYGHRYILNLRENEIYTRYYHRLDKQGTAKETKESSKFTSDPAFYVPNPGIGNKDPESVNPRFRLRGNGVWQFKPVLTAAEYKKYIHSAEGIAAFEKGLQPEKAGSAASVIFRVQSANVTTSQKISATFQRKTADDSTKLSVSSDNGVSWKPVWSAEGTGEVKADLKLIGEVNGSYEPMLKIELLGKAAAGDAQLQFLAIETTTELNSKTQPKLNLGKNTIYVGAGDQTDSIVYWPDLQGDAWKSMAVDSKNILTDKKHAGWHSVMRQAAPGEAYVVFKMDAPNDITRLVYGGRIYNYGAGLAAFEHSFDGGKTWERSYACTEGGGLLHDIIRYETIEKIPAGTKSVLFKYLLDSKNAPSEQSWGFYAMRMEANFKVADSEFKPMEVTFKWKEVQKDLSTIERSHSQLIEKAPFKYVINVGGEDRPIMESLQSNLKGAAADVKYGYSDGKDVGGEKFVYRWRSDGNNLAKGKPYTLSIPPNKSDDKGNKLTDGIVGPPFAGGGEPGQFGCMWDKGTPEITVDLGKDEQCGAFRIHMTAGWPWWDAFDWEVQDKVEVQVSSDGKSFTSAGNFNFNLRYKDVSINQMLPDDETATGWNFELIPEKPVTARYVKYVVNRQRWVSITEVQVFDQIKYEPFDLKIALP